MGEKKPLANYSGRIKELQAGDTLPDEHAKQHALDATADHTAGSLTAKFLPAMKSDSTKLVDSPLQTDGTNVGLGIAPSYPLHISAPTGTVRIASTDNDKHAILSLVAKDPGGVERKALLGADKASPYGLFFSGDNNNIQMSLDPSGNVNIPGLTASRVVVADTSSNLASGSNTNTEIASAVSNSHVRSHALDSTSDHSIGGLGSSLPVFTDATPKLITKSVANALAALGLGTALPAFSVKPTSNQNDIAVGSEVTVVFGTEIFDQGNNFANNTFTAPVTGKYQLNVRIRLQNLDSAAECYYVILTTTNRDYSSIFDLSKLSGDAAFWMFTVSVLADMNANDTAHVVVYQSSGTQQTDIENTTTSFSGYLVC